MDVSGVSSISRKYQNQRVVQSLFLGYDPEGSEQGGVEKNDLKRVNLWKSVEEKYPRVEM